MKNTALVFFGVLMVLLSACEDAKTKQVAGYVRQLAVASDEKEEARLAELIRINSKGSVLSIVFMDGRGQVIDSVAYHRLLDEKPDTKPQLLFIVGSPIEVVASRSFLSRETAKYILLPD